MCFISEGGAGASLSSPRIILYNSFPDSRRRLKPNHFFFFFFFSRSHDLLSIEITQPSQNDTMPDFYWKTPSQTHVITHISSEVNASNWTVASQLAYPFEDGSHLSPIHADCSRILRDAEFRLLDFFPGGEHPIKTLVVKEIQGGHVRPVLATPEYILPGGGFKLSDPSPAYQKRVNHILRIVLTTSQDITSQVSWYQPTPTTVGSERGLEACVQLYQLFDHQQKLVDALSSNPFAAPIAARAVVNTLRPIAADLSLAATLKGVANDEELFNISYNYSGPEIKETIVYLYEANEEEEEDRNNEEEEPAGVSDAYRRKLQSMLCHIVTQIAILQPIATPYVVRTNDPDPQLALGVIEHQRRERVARRLQDVTRVPAPASPLDIHLDRFLGTTIDYSAELARQQEQTATLCTYKRPTFETARPYAGHLVLRRGLLMRLDGGRPPNESADDPKEEELMPEVVVIKEEVEDRTVMDEAYAYLLEVAAASTTELKVDVSTVACWQHLIRDGNYLKLSTSLPAMLQDKIRTLLPHYYELREHDAGLCTRITDQLCMIAGVSDAADSTWLLATPMLERLATTTLPVLSPILKSLCRNYIQHFLGCLIQQQVAARCARLPAPSKDVDVESYKEQATEAAIDPARFLVDRSHPLNCDCETPLGDKIELYNPRSQAVKRLIGIKTTLEGEEEKKAGTGRFMKAPLETRLSSLAPYSRADIALFR